jgi:Nucleotidyl transferase AbiEii toxin, Type IV TA system
MQKFTPRLDMLLQPQRRLWNELGTTPPEFVLYGGTALALRLGHRQSVDFDFFSNEVFIPSELLKKIAYLKGATVQQSAENTLTCLVERGDPVQVSFFGGLGLRRVGEPDRVMGVNIASLLDLAATKVKVVLDRASYRDYFDIDALIAAGIELTQALAAARAVYGAEFNPLLSAKALAYFDDGDLRRLDPAIKQRLLNAAREVDIEKLPSLPVQRAIEPSAD